ncbi:MAG: ion channel [Gammaproteobacteria bacterium]
MLRRWSNHPSAALLLVQLAGVVLYPLLETASRGRWAFNVFGIAVLGIALWVVRRSPWLTWVGLLLAMPIVILSILQVTAPDANLALITAVLESVFYFYATGSLIAYMLQDDVATTDELFAVAATFTLLAWGFADAYLVCQELIPHSFSAASNSLAPRTWMELLFLSFTTLSGVGLGDILPVTPMARALVMLEQLAGVMYIALVVSRLIGLMTVAARRQ